MMGSKDVRYRTRKRWTKAARARTCYGLAATHCLAGSEMLAKVINTAIKTRRLGDNWGRMIDDAQECKVESASGEITDGYLQTVVMMMNGDAEVVCGSRTRPIRLLSAGFPKMTRMRTSLCGSETFVEVKTW